MKFIYLLILIPFINFIFFTFFAKKFEKKIYKFFGIFMIFSLLLLFFYIFVKFYFFNINNIIIENLFTWISIYRLNISFSLLLDQISFIMLSLVISISFLIYCFSCFYMDSIDKFHYLRFFSYLNLFISSMILLVLSDNIMLMYFGWEIVGVCSYLLIGFYCSKKKNGLSSSKALLITRIGDFFIFIAIFMLYIQFNTVNFQYINNIINNLTLVNSNNLFIISLFLFLGAIGKSAQFPFQVWLSDAMVGPTPVSALIHSATMITVGIYLIIRMHCLFFISPLILHIISIISIITIVIGCFCALAQKDIKQILAYSTISQIGYMFLALSVKSCDSAMIHLITHGIFKALLFLSTASLMLCYNNIQDVFKICAKKNSVPFLYFCFLISCASLISFPILTSGFYSKENILFNILQNGNYIIFFISLFCTFLTSIYTFKMFFLIFYKKKTSIFININNILQYFPMFILIIFSTFFGFIVLPDSFHIFVYKIFSYDYKFYLEFCSGILSILGIFFSYYFWIFNKNILSMIFKNKFMNIIYNICFYSFGCNYLYKIFFILPYKKITNILYYNPFKIIIYYYIFLFNFIKKIHFIFVNGFLRWYIKLTIFSFLIMLFIIIKL